MQLAMEKAHGEALKPVIENIDKEIIGQNSILKLTTLRDTYITGLEHSQFPNANYRSENLKHKLQRHKGYKDKLSSCTMGCFKSYIMHSFSIDTDTAVVRAYALGSAYTIKGPGIHLHKLIIDSFKNSPELKWPPTVDYLRQDEDIIPKELSEFLNYGMAGKPTTTASRAHRLVMTIGQDICRAATNGSWKSPKHILSCMTLRHLFRSDRLITLINRMSHSENNSFSLEFETAIAQAVEETSSLLSTSIIRSPQAPAVFHSEFDNFDQLLNDLTGMDSIYTAHGIMPQDIQSINKTSIAPISSVVRAQRRTNS